MNAVLCSASHLHKIQILPQTSNSQKQPILLLQYWYALMASAARLAIILLR